MLISFIEVVLLFVILFLSYKLIYVPIQDSKYFAQSLATIDPIVKDFEPNSTASIDPIHTKSQNWYDTTKKEEIATFYKTLISPETILIVIFAGETHYELVERLANDMKLDKKKLLKLYEKESLFEEADIFAGQYILPRHANEKAVIHALLDASKQKLQVFIKKHCQEKSLSVKKVKALLTIASIIQKESNSPDEMPYISSVIYNRLEKDMRLQMDGTLNYGKYAHTIVTPERLKEDNSAYNTYKHKGLPPAPLSAVSLSALKAAYTPKTNSYLFFMLKSDGMHKFSTTYREHLGNIKKFKESQKKKHAKKELLAKDKSRNKEANSSKAKVKVKKNRT